MIPNAIDTSKFKFSMESRNKIREHYNVGEAIVIGIVGRLEKWKNQSFLLDVLKKVNEIENTYLLMVGDYRQPLPQQETTDRYHEPDPDGVEEPAGYRTRPYL